MDCTDAELMLASREDPAAFTLRFDRHVVAVHRVLARRLGDPGADDLTGEVFRIAFEELAAVYASIPITDPTWQHARSATNDLTSPRQELEAARRDRRTDDQIEQWS